MAHRAFIYFVLTVVIVCSCLVEYWGARGLACLTGKKRYLVAGAIAGFCGLGALAFRGSVLASDCFVLSVALFAAVLLAPRLRSMGALMAFLVAGAVADVISTYFGPTRLLVFNWTHHLGSSGMRFLAVTVPLEGKPIPVIGVADMLFFAVCVTVTRRFGWPEPPVFLVPLASLLAALAVGLLIGPTPAIPFLALGMLAYVYITGRQRPRNIKP
jgi:hypothetical protein